MSAFFEKGFNYVGRIFEYISEVPLYVWLFIVTLFLYMGFVLFVSWLTDKIEAKKENK